MPAAPDSDNNAIQEPGASPTNNTAAGSKTSSAPSAVATPSSPAPLTFAHPIGIIEPPPDIKLVIDRTADFVRKTGSEGEQQLIIKNRGNKKFAFLLSTSPYHAYYKSKIAGATITAPSTSPSPPPTATLINVPYPIPASQQAVDQQPPPSTTLSTIPEKLSSWKPPPTLQDRLHAYIETTKVARDLSSLSLLSASSALPTFYAAYPHHYTSADVDVVKITALYIAYHGDTFLHSLQQRERNNHQFDFLKTVHPLYPYYQHLISSYKLIINKPTTLLSAYREQLADSEQQLILLLAKAKYKAQQDEEERSQKQREEEESQVMVNIDWHNFHVVQSIEFLPEEENYLPPPKKTIADMQIMLAELALEEERDKEEQDRQQREKEKQKLNEEKEQMMGIDNEDEEEIEPKDGKSRDGKKASNGIIEHKEEELEIRPAGASASASSTPQTISATMTASSAAVPKLVKCVICGDSIAVEDLEEHLRIELLDPTWKQQKQALMDRNRETSLVSGVSMSENLKRLERKRKEMGREGKNKEEEEKQEQQDRNILQTIARDTSNIPTITSGDAANQNSRATSTTTTAEKDKPTAKPLPIAYPPPIAVPPPASVRAAAAALQGGALFPPGYGPLHQRHQPGTTTTTVPRSVDNGEPAAKKARPSSPTATDTNIPSAEVTSATPKTTFIPEAEWIATHPATINITLQVPNDSTSSFNLKGQTISLSLKLTDTIDAIKSNISATLNNLGANRMQFQVMSDSGNRGFLKEGHSFAYYNLNENTTIQLKLKERGGKKK